MKVLFIVLLCCSAAVDMYGQSNVSQSRFDGSTLNHRTRGDASEGKSSQTCRHQGKDPEICIVPPQAAFGPLWRTTPPANNVLVVDERFTKNMGFLEGALAGQHAHWLLDFHAGANDAYESLGTCCTGPVGLMIDGFADAGGLNDQSKANLVPLMVGALQKAGSTRPTWGEDINIQCARASSVLCTPLELDLSNTDSADDLRQNSIGMKLISSGTHRVGIGAAITAMNPPFNSWQLAALFANYHQTGIQVSNGDAQSVGLLLTALGAGSNAMKIIPPDDTSAPEILGYGADANVISWHIDNDGVSSWRSVQANGISSGSYATGSNCSSAASQAICRSAAAGSIAIAASARTVVVNTSAVTSSSQIIITFDESLGAKLGITCNDSSESEAAAYVVSARAPGVSFTIKTNSAPRANSACLSYIIEN